MRLTFQSITQESFSEMRDIMQRTPLMLKGWGKMFFDTDIMNWV